VRACARARVRSFGRGDGETWGVGRVSDEVEVRDREAALVDCDSVVSFARSDVDVDVDVDVSFVVGGTMERGGRSGPSRRVGVDGARRDAAETEAREVGGPSRGGFATATTTATTVTANGNGAVPLHVDGVNASVMDSAMRLRAVDIVKSAKTRWLKNTEVCDALLNYVAYGFETSSEAPVKPRAGTLYLINRRVVRFFRKDGLNWQKKKDGKTVRETHEKLKVGTVELLNCYYTHCEDDPRFQRRCYWLLNMDEGAVLVHYLRVKLHPARALAAGSAAYAAYAAAINRKSKGGVVKVGGAKRTTAAGSSRAERSGRNQRLTASIHDGEYTAVTTRKNVDEMLQRDDDDLAQIFQETGLDEGDGVWSSMFDPESGAYADGPTTSLSQLMREFSTFDEHVDDAYSDRRHLSSYEDRDSPPIDDGPVLSLEEFERRIERIREQWQGSLSMDKDSQSIKIIDSQMRSLQEDVDRAVDASRRRGATNTPSGEPSGSTEPAASDEHSGQGASGGVNGAHTDVGVIERPRTQIFRQIPATPSGVHILWSIVDFTPSWDDVTGGAKVIITGNPLVEFDQEIDMCCVFGTKSVRVEKLAPNVLKCEVPPHPPGRVSMFLAMDNGNGHPVSEMCSFEYVDSAVARSQKNQPTSKLVDPSAQMSDRDFQMRLVQLLTTIGSDSSETSNEKSGEGTAGSQLMNLYESVSRSTMHVNALSALRAAERLQIDPYNMDDVNDEDLMVLLNGMIQARLKSVIVHENRRTKARLAVPSAATVVNELEEVAKVADVEDGVVEEVVERTQETHKTLMKLALAPSAYNRKDRQGLTLFHCCAALGIEWAVRAMCTTGIDLNHADKHKRTALHWAVARGHEMVVATLLNYGAKSRAVAMWNGQMFAPAELAIHCGYEGIAAYISEANLTSALDSINLRTNRASHAPSVSPTTQFRRTMLPSDSENSDGEGASFSKPRHRKKAMKSILSSKSRSKELRVEGSDDSETEAATIVKRAEHARESLLTTLRELNVKPEYVDAQLHAKLGKRRVRRMKEGEIQNLMSELLTPVGEEPINTQRLTRRPVMRARRLPRGKAVQVQSKRTEETKETRSSDDDDEEAIHKNFVRIQSSLKSSEARAQYLRLRRSTHQLRTELRALATASFSDDE